MQLVRVIEVGMDVDGDGSADLDPNRISYFGNSAGGMYGSMLLALEPSIYAARCIDRGRRDVSRNMDDGHPAGERASDSSSRSECLRCSTLPASR